MALSEEEKKKIEEDEYRKSLRTEKANRKKWYQKTGWIIALLILFFPLGIFLMWKYASWNIFVKVLITLIYLLFLSSNYLFGTGNRLSSKTTQPETNSQLTEEQRKQQLQELSDIYCSERSKPNVRYVSLDDYISMYEASGQTVTLHPVINISPAADKCNKVMDICLEMWTADDCKSIAERKVWIGMTDDQLILSWGMPNDKNNTVTSAGIHSQWVYGDFKPYVYLEGNDENNLKVISWQN